MSAVRVSVCVCAALRAACACVRVPPRARTCVRACVHACKHACTGVSVGSLNGTERPIHSFGGSAAPRLSVSLLLSHCALRASATERCWQSCLLRLPAVRTSLAGCLRPQRRRVNRAECTRLHIATDFGGRCGDSAATGGRECSAERTYVPLTEHARHLRIVSDPAGRWAH